MIKKTNGVCQPLLLMLDDPTSQKDDCLFSIDLTDLETGIYTSGSVLEMKKT
jgi:hypothetical protein